MLLSITYLFTHLQKSTYTSEHLSVLKIERKSIKILCSSSCYTKLFPNAYLDDEKKYIYLFNNTELDDRFKLSHRTSSKLLFPKNEGESQLYSNIYPGKFGNNSININNVKEISSKRQEKVKLLIKNMEKKHKTKKNKNINKRKTKKII